ncbi:MAG: hypothetical protein RIC15_01600 [Vicingaceae bacterium]
MSPVFQLILAFFFALNLGFSTLEHLLAHEHEHEIHHCTSETCFGIKKIECKDNDKITNKKFTIVDYRALTPVSAEKKELSALEQGQLEAYSKGAKGRGPPYLV